MLCRSPDSILCTYVARTFVQYLTGSVLEQVGSRSFRRSARFSKVLRSSGLQAQYNGSEPTFLARLRRANAKRHISLFFALPCTTPISRLPVERSRLSAKSWHSCGERNEHQKSRLELLRI